jgi:C4-dicarboxylate transporter DctQ subunit
VPGGEVRNLLAKAIKIYDRVIDSAAFLTGILVIFLMLSVGLEVALRYFLGRPTSWVVEIAGYILLFIPFLVAAWVLRREGHVKMDLVLTRLRPKNQSLVNAVTSFIGAIVCFVLALSGLKTSLYFRGYQTPTILMLPKSLIIAIIFVGSFLLFIQFMRRTCIFLGKWKTPEEEKCKER